MFTQAELVSTKEEVVVYWLDHDVSGSVPIRVGRGVRLAETKAYWRVNRVFTTMKNLADLPVKHRIGTIVEIN